MVFPYTYAYNKQGNLSYIVDKAGRLNNTKYDGILKMYNYDAYSRLNSTVLKTDYTSRTTTYSYANVGGTGYSTRVEEVVDNGERTWYNYDSNGNITQILVNDETVYEYQYDVHNQLIKEDNKVLNKTIEYTYDLTGNITSKKEYEYKTTNLLKEITYTYDNTWLDLLTSYDGKTLTTDAIGNLLTYDGNTYTWINGRSLASISGTKQIAYTYNESGIRTSKTVDGATTYYEVEDSKVVYEKTGNTIIYYIYDGNGELLGFEYNNNKYYYKKNVQGDIIGILDSFLEEIVTYTYDSWGKLISIKDSNDIEVTSTTHIGYINPYRYRGYRYDNETGYYYLQSRYYNPEWGRFINADAIIANVGVADGYNLFAYCANNPINRCDEGGNLWGLAVTIAMITTVVVIYNKVLKYSKQREKTTLADAKATTQYVQSGVLYKNPPKDGKRRNNYRLVEDRKGLAYNKTNRLQMAKEVHNQLNVEGVTNRTIANISAEIYAHQLGADLLYDVRDLWGFSYFYKKCKEADINEDEKLIILFNFVEAVFG